MSDVKYEILAEDLEKQGVDVSKTKELLKQQHIETPSWGVVIQELVLVFFIKKEHSKRHGTLGRRFNSSQVYWCVAHRCSTYTVGYNG